VASGVLSSTIDEWGYGSDPRRRWGEHAVKGADLKEDRLVSQSSLVGKRSAALQAGLRAIMTTRTLGLIAVTFGLAVGLEDSPVAVGIKETAKLTISALVLPRAIEVVDPPLLALSNVFAGTFIGTPATEPDPSWTRYTIAFDVQTLRGVKQAAYVIYYSTNRSTGEGFIYLPGRGDGPYRRNISTILRDGQDGRWHRTTEAWSAAINARLQ
jgi:hypothetical protein